MNRLYGLAIFLGSFLLFLVEPMAARRLLPLLGGSAAVWVTCLIFFQFALLLGYLVAHAVVTRLRRRIQIAVYFAVLLLCLWQVFAVAGTGKSVSPLLLPPHPIVSVFALLSVGIGLPFTVLSMNAPLLQAWHSAHSSAGSGSYKFYALSNLGSLLALAAYPLLLEPRLGLHAQVTLWRAGFVIFVVICAILFIGLWSPREASFAGPQRQSVPTSKLRNLEIEALCGRERVERREDEWEPATEILSEAKDLAHSSGRVKEEVLLWLLLAACGSWLLCAITNHLNQDVAAVPLLWVLPLIAYLLSFVWTFSGERFYPRKWVLLLMPLLLAALGYLLYQTDLTVGRGWLVFFFCGALLLCCVLCHGELYRLRPAPAHLTRFYLTVAFGGMLGSIFVGIVAPVIFPANYEVGGGLVFLCLLVFAVVWHNGIGWRLLWSAAIVVVAAMAVRQVSGERADAIAQARSFYGSLRVLESPAAAPDAPYQRTRALFHGTVLHGAEYFGGPQAATPFYGRDAGPVLAIDLCCGNRPRRIGVIGLGAGSLAAYVHAGDTIRFYEIDPLIVKMARDYFTCMRASPAKVEVVLGDGRISLAQELLYGTPQNFDVLAIDAFSGGAIPVHLLTHEAVELYLRHLRPGGILAINITNVYLDLAPIVAAQAQQAGLQARYFESDVHYPGGYVVDWILLTNNRDFLARPEIQRGQPVSTRPALPLWTDDYNSLFPVFSLRQQL